MGNSNTFKKRSVFARASLIFSLIALIFIIVMFWGVLIFSAPFFSFLFSILALGSGTVALILATKRKESLADKGMLIVSFLIGLLCLFISLSILWSFYHPRYPRLKDARIISDMDYLREVGEIFYGNHGTCRGLSNDPDEDILEKDIKNEGGTYSIYINNNGKAYCAIAKLNSGRYWCVDSGLRSKDYGKTPPSTCMDSCEQNNNCTCGTEAPSTPRNKNSG